MVTTTIMSMTTTIIMAASGLVINIVIIVGTCRASEAKAKLRDEAGPIAELSSVGIGLSLLLAAELRLLRQRRQDLLGRRVDLGCGQ
jgi:hypothetical protein